MNDAQHRSRTARAPRGVTLVELLVVLAIVSALLAMLLPAVNAARNRARGAVCQNNVRQLQLALQNHLELGQRFPEYGKWTTVVLEWIEERPLSEALHNGKLQAAEHRPPLFQCPAQSDLVSDQEPFRTCWYQLVVDRDRRNPNKLRSRPAIHDRPRDAAPLRPWFYGPEVSIREFDELVAGEVGPHVGLFQ